MKKITLLLLPGMDGTGELFAPFIAALGCEFATLVVTYPTRAPLDYAELETIARAAIPQDGAYVIVGESFSGPIAISLAAHATPNLKALVLCCSFVQNPRPALAGLRSLIDVLPISVAPTALLSHLLLGRFSSRALRTLLSQALAQVSPSVLRARLKAVLDVDVSARLAAVSVPVLYLRASSDRLVPVNASARVARICANTKVVEIEAPHFLLQVAPAAAAVAVTAFLRGLHDGD